MKKAKKIIILIILIIAFPISLGLIVTKFPKVYGETYYAELPEYYSRLTSATGNRIIIIGGSNIAFGIDTELMEQLLSEMGYDYTVCPFGLYGAIGSSVMLDLAEDVLRSGDIVILSFEPGSDALSDYFGATAFLKAVEGNPFLLSKLNKDHFSAAVGNLIPFLQEYYALATSDTPLKLDSVYQKAAFNEECNMVYPREGNIMTLGYDPTSTEALSDIKISDAFSQQVQSFCKTADKCGARVYYSFCPINRSSLEISATSEDDTVESELLAFYNNCISSFGCRMISDPRRYVFDAEWFYDSNVHLNEAGAKLRTLQLVEDLLPEFGCYSSVSYTAPAKPAFQEKVKVSEAEDFGYFEYERYENSNAYIVSNVTDKGKSEVSLTVPASYKGYPVIGFTESTFKDCNILEELRLSSSILSIPDNAFISCSSLSRLILEHTDTPCKISSNSLTGCKKLKILVPSESYSMYRDGQGCEVNNWEPYLSQIYTY